MLESKFQKDLREDLERLFPGCMIFKMDPNLYGGGIPDLLILYEDTWAALECKRSLKERNDPEPNQEWHVDKMNNMSFAAFIYPENREEIIDELLTAFRVTR